MNTISLPLLVLQSLRHYWRSELAVAAGAAVAALTLTGALLVGDSLKGSLHDLVDKRLGRTEHVVVPHDGFLRASLADSLTHALDASTAPVMQRPATVSAAGGKRQANRAVIVGVDNRFWKLCPSENLPLSLAKGEAAVNRDLADKLGIELGDQIVVRFERGDLLPLEAPFSGGERNRVSLRLKIARIIGPDAFGDFSLKAEHYAVYNVFVPLATLAQATGRPGDATAILIDHDSPQELDLALREKYSIRDAGIHVRRVANGSFLEIHTDRVFIDSVTLNPVLHAFETACPVFTYFVNALTYGSESTPYSFVSTPPAGIDVFDNQIILSRWAANDLSAGVGDTVTLRYFVPRFPSGLAEDSSAFVVTRVVPQTLPWTDSTLMPAFPGLADAGSCTEWDPGTPIDLDLIRPKDEAYWEQWRGTPKAFVSLATAQRMWSNRFGSCTAIRIEADEAQSTREVESILATILSPAFAGLMSYPIREAVEQAVTEGISFAPLFTGLSFFLIAASVILTTLLFGFSVGSRRSHYTFLIAAGFRRAQVSRIFLGEALVAALIGAVIGAALSPLYTAGILVALQTIWHAAAQAPHLSFHVQWQSILIGTIATVAVASGAMWLSVRRHTAELFLHRKRSVAIPHRRALWIVVAVFCAAAAGVLLLTTGSATGQDTAGVFFGAGALLLVSQLCLWNILLTRWLIKPHAGLLTYWGLVVSNTARRKNHSIATAALFACALFVLGGVSAFRHGHIANPRERFAGTGGFWWYAETMTGVSRAVIDALAEKKLGQTDALVPMRLRDGDDASCFNLNRVRTPPLVGLDPSTMDSLSSFSFASVGREGLADNPWTVLDLDLGEGIVAAIADQSVIEWGLGMALGDTIVYTNEEGEPLQAVLVGGLANSVFQGKVLIAEDRFVKHYPSTDGYRLFLIDASAGSEGRIADALRTRLSGNGVEVESASQRLASFNRVENTYLSIFAILGMLGLLVGTIGLAVVLMRNALERRHELALLMAQGFRKKTIQRLIFGEHAFMCGMGLVSGLVAALVAITPSMMSSGEHFALSALLSTLTLVIGCGTVALWIAATRV